MRRLMILTACLTAVCVWPGSRDLVAGQGRTSAPGAGKPPVHAQPVKRLLIRNAMVVYGNAKPAFGPVDILVQDGLIARVGRTPAG